MVSSNLAFFVARSLRRGSPFSSCLCALWTRRSALTQRRYEIHGGHGDTAQAEWET